jgi:uncharacterized protein (UPF0332 family)
VKDELLATAYRLLDTESGAVSQVDGRRAVSTAYYAVFHAMCESNAYALLGSPSEVTADVWSSCYRALEHRQIKPALRQMVLTPSFAELTDVLVTAASLQERRHLADYDPSFVVSLTEAGESVSEAQDAVGKLASAPLAARKALAVALIIAGRRGRAD